MIFSDHDLRVGNLTVSVGADIATGAELYRVSGTEKIVDLYLALTNQQLAVVGTQVSVTLPDGVVTVGSIASVGEPTERGGDTTAAAEAPQGAAAKFVLPVTIALSDQVIVGAFPRASVSVQFSSTFAAGVLTVPVEALIATGADTFAVETADRAGVLRQIPVTVGAFFSGRV